MAITFSRGIHTEVSRGRGWKASMLKLVKLTQYFNHGINLLPIIANHFLMSSACQLNLSMSVGGDIHIITAISSSPHSRPVTRCQGAKPVHRAEFIHFVLNSEHRLNSSCWHLFISACSIPLSHPVLPAWKSALDLNLLHQLSAEGTAPGSDVREVALSRRITSPRDRTSRSQTYASPPSSPHTRRGVCTHGSWASLDVYQPEP